MYVDPWLIIPVLATLAAFFYVAAANKDIGSSSGAFGLEVLAGGIVILLSLLFVGGSWLAYFAAKFWGLI